WLKIKTQPQPGKEAQETSHLVQLDPASSTGISEQFALFEGSFAAELFLELEHNLTTTLPVGRWSVQNDQSPRFTQALRLQGQGSDATVEAKIAPDDLLRLQTAVADREGLGAIVLEYRINDEPAKSLHWLEGV